MEKVYKQSPQIKAGYVDGLSIFITSVITDTDDSGKITGYMIELAVYGEKVKLTLYDTTVKVRVQGGKQQQKYTNRALLPYIDRMIKQKTVNSLISPELLQSSKITFWLPNFSQKLVYAMQ